MTEELPHLTAAFFNRPATTVARDLIGQSLLRRIDGLTSALVIEETEAYLGTHDLACHSSRGRTARTEVMFGPPANLYIYLVYRTSSATQHRHRAGRSWCRRADPKRRAESLGPGRLGHALALTMDLKGRPAVPETGLWFVRTTEKPVPVRRTPRIGIDYAGPKWASRKLRFVKQAP